MFSRFYFPRTRTIFSTVRQKYYGSRLLFRLFLFFSSVRKKIEKKFWDMEIIGNRQTENIIVCHRICIKISTIKCKDCQITTHTPRAVLIRFLQIWSMLLHIYNIQSNSTLFLTLNSRVVSIFKTLVYQVFATSDQLKFLQKSKSSKNVSKIQLCKSTMIEVYSHKLKDTYNIFRHF